MILEEKSFFLPKILDQNKLLSYFRKKVLTYCDGLGVVPIRFVITETTDKGYQCELGVFSGEEVLVENFSSIFNFRKRDIENQDKFNAVVLVPTGIGAKLGGHSGDGGAMVRLLSSVCDTLVTHPNAVNAADINELPDNALYVEGSVISRLIMGAVGLQRVRSNRILAIVDEHSDKMFHELAINSVSAARVSLGIDCVGVVKMKDQMIMRALFAESGRAVGRIDYFEKLKNILDTYKDKYDAIALTSLIEVPEHFHKDYFIENMEVNPWGGVEAMLTHMVSSLYNVPSAHSPMMTSNEVLNLDVGIVDPRKAAEAVSTTYLHCILKGLHRSPKIIDLSKINMGRDVLSVEDISCLVIPEGCLGLPTLAALEQGIHVIAVTENKNCMKNDLKILPFKHGRFHVAENYLEAVGIMAAIKAGVAVETVRRPLNYTSVSEINGIKQIEKIAQNDLSIRES